MIDRLPVADRQFLLSISVAERVSAALANELTGRRDGQLILERLTAQHALVVGLAGRNDWFSIHPLLREMLLHRLSLEQPDAVAELCLRASRWFADQGEPIPAIRYATQAHAWDEVGRLTALAMPLVLTPAAAALVAGLAAAAAAGRRPVLASRFHTTRMVRLSPRPTWIGIDSSIDQGGSDGHRSPNREQ